MAQRINQSWREQRKGVRATQTDGYDEETIHFISLWEASHYIAETEHCKHETARKEIKKAIRLGCARYGYKWTWEHDKNE